MKILTAPQIGEIDQYTIEHEPVASIDLMERAAVSFTNWLTRNVSPPGTIKIFCGTGNNGGDGLAIARLLYLKNFTVEVFIVRYSKSTSADFAINEKRLKKFPGIGVTNLRKNDPLPEFGDDDILIDAMWGSGLNRPIEGFAGNIIDKINSSQNLVISVDMPSGLLADRHSTGKIIQANITLTFQLPKLALIFKENYPYAGKWFVLDIGLDENKISKTPTHFFYVTAELASALFRPREKFDHKGTYGHALIAGGSFGKIGAISLTAKACLRAGAGLTTAWIPKCGYLPLQTALPEVMVMTSNDEQRITGFPDLEKFDVIGIGPGLGTDEKTAHAFGDFLEKNQKPMVIDADGLNLLAKNKDWLTRLPENTILTPHPGEFERLAGKSNNDFHHLELQRELSQKYKVLVVLKQAHTSISCPDGRVFFNSTGNPGLASGGTGDTLTGIITGLLAQNYNPGEACILGVYLGGLAADLAAFQTGEAFVSATDIIEHLGEALQITGENSF